MKNGYHIFLLLVLFCFAFNSHGQNNESKQIIVNKIITFQQNRFTNSALAEKTIKEAIEIAQEIDSKADILTCKILLGEYYDDNNNFNAAFTQYTQASSIANETNDKGGLALAKYNLGILFYKQENDNKQEKALAYLNESIGLSQISKDDLLLAKAYNFSSFIFYDLNKLEQAKKAALNALTLFKSANKKNRIPQCYITLSRIHNKLEQPNKALKYLDSATTLYKRQNNLLELNNALLVKAEINLNQKKYTQALTLAQSVNDDPKVMTEQKIYALQLLYEINKAMNNTKKSLGYLEENKTISDSLYKLDRNKMLESVQSEIDAKNQLETLEKENRINELNIQQNRYWIIILVSLSILLFVVALLLFQVYRKNKLRSEKEKFKIKQESLALEQKLLRTQMNPHFIANSLAAIQGNIYKQDKEKSVTYLSKFAKLMRFILESSRKKEIALDKEINSLKHYLDLQKLLLEDKLQYTIDIDKKITPEEILIPPMLLQPFIENAIKHGIELKENGGLVSLIFIKKEKNILQIEIIDNGLGRKAVAELYKNRKRQHLSFSSNIISERIENIKTEGGKQIKQIIEDVIKNGEVAGTKVTLILPIKNIFD